MASPSLTPSPASVHPPTGGGFTGSSVVPNEPRRLHQRLWQSTTTLIAFAADGVAALAGILAGYHLYQMLPFGRHLRYGYAHLAAVLLIGAGFVLAIFYTQGLYRCRGSLLHVREFEIILRAVAIAMVAAAAASAFVHAMPIPRLLFVACFPMLVTAVIIERLLLNRFWPRLRNARSLFSQALIIGATETGLRLFRKLAQSPHHGIHVAGFLSTGPDLGTTVYFAPSYGQERQKAEVVGHFNQIERVVADRCDVDSLIIAADLSGAQLEQVRALTRQFGLGLRFVPQTGGFYSHWIEYSDIDGIPLGTCRVPGQAALLTRAVKRLLDITVAAALLVLLSPLTALIMAIIRLDSPGAALFRQARVGQDGRPFTILKFRTMRADACIDAVSPKTSSDPRITRCGRWLRRLSLDELPQLFNVLRGEMSLVGPRPEMTFIVAGYSELERERLRVKPGVTGLWQISADRARPIHENIEYDLYYLEHQSVFLDFAILLNTVIFVVRGIGAW